MTASGSTGSNSPHDALFRRTFSNVEHAAAELRAILPTALLSKVDLSTLRLSSGTYVDASFSISQSDLLFSVQVQGKPALLYLLFEHQSTVDALMPFRMLKYVVRILEQYLAGSASKPLPLPIVIPLVLHHSATGWTGPTRLEDLFDSELTALPCVLELVPRLGFVLDDISRLTDEQLLERALGVFPTLTLWALRDARQPGRVQKAIERWVWLIQALYESERGGEALMAPFRYLSLVVEDLSPQTLIATVASAPTEAKETLMTTLAERWKAEGKIEGKLEGKIEGKLEGKIEGKLEGKIEGARWLLLQQLGFKFGELSSADRARIESASEEQLLAWTARLLSADSLLAVFC